MVPEPRIGCTAAVPGNFKTCSWQVLKFLNSKLPQMADVALFMRHGLFSAEVFFRRLPSIDLGTDLGGLSIYHDYISLHQQGGRRGKRARESVRSEGCAHTSGLPDTFLCLGVWGFRFGPGLSRIRPASHFGPCRLCVPHTGTITPMVENHTSHSQVGAAEW